MMNGNAWIWICMVVLAAGCGRQGNIDEAVGAEPVAESPAVEELLRKAGQY